MTGVLTATTMVSAAPPVHAAPTTTQWATCQDGFECATVQAPLDYDEPQGKQIDLALIKLPATDPGKRKGALFVNFGGPGSDGVGKMRDRARVTFSDDIRAHFDLIGVDMRGIGRSTAVHCFTTEHEKSEFFGSIPDFPFGVEQEHTFMDSAAELGRRCQEHSAELLNHMSTANTAHDLEHVRVALGEPDMNFIGYSYGSVIGATYANLYPQRARAIILDGALDLVGNSRGHGDEAKTLPVDVRQDVAQAAQDTLTRFFTMCEAAGEKCAFAQGGNLAGKWSELLAHLQHTSIEHPDGITYTYSSLVSMVYYNLFKPVKTWPTTAAILQKLYETKNTNNAEVVATAHESYQTNPHEAYNAIQCLDSDEPTKTSLYSELGASQDKKVPGFGRLVTFNMMPCAAWPAEDADRYTGPWNAKFAHELLVINTTHDPATPHTGAKMATKQLGKARLLTLDAPGHTTMYSPASACVEQARLAYLVSGTMPAKNKVCPADEAPWH